MSELPQYLRKMVCSFIVNRHIFVTLAYEKSKGKVLVKFQSPDLNISDIVGTIQVEFETLSLLLWPSGP